MGQLQRRAEQHYEGQFASAPEGSIPWQPGGKVEKVPTGEKAVTSRPTPPRWQINALVFGGIIIVVLGLILLFA